MKSDYGVRVARRATLRERHASIALRQPVTMHRTALWWPGSSAAGSEDMPTPCGERIEKPLARKIKEGGFRGRCPGVPFLWSH